MISCVSYCLQLFSHNNRLSFSSTGKNFQKISIDQPKIKEPTPVRDSLAPLPNHCAQRCKYRQTFATISCCTWGFQGAHVPLPHSNTEWVVSKALLYAPYSNTPAHSSVTHSRLLWTTELGFDYRQWWDYTISLGNLFKCLTTLRVKVTSSV